MPWKESQNLAIVQTELDDVFMQEFNIDTQRPGAITADNGALFKQTPISNAAHIEEVFAGVGLFDEIGETQDVPGETPKVGNKFTTYVSDFGKSIYISKNLFDDNMHSVWQKAVRDFATKARVTMIQKAMGLYRGGFSTTLTADGQPWFSASHTTLKGATVNNLMSGGSSALSSTSLNTAIIKLWEQQDQAGVVMNNDANILVVPPALWKTAVELTDSALVADSSSNAINVYRSAMGLEVWTSNRLGAAVGGSDTAWFMLSRNHAATRYIRQGLETVLVPWYIGDNRQYKYTANYREAYSCIDYVGAVGSLGV